MIAVGDTLNGRYRLDAPLAQGGFAVVYRATDLTLGRQVAVKVLHAHLGGADRDFAARFAAEARTAAALAHPNILAVHDFGQHDDASYLVMPLVAGGTLHDRVRNGPLPPEWALHYLRQAAAALDYAHRRGLVHRDVKPQNMLLDEDGAHLLLADFGIARALEGTSTQASLVVGTVAYMAPEQLEGHVSRATDIYALGCVAFALLTGQPPYAGSTPQVMHGHLHLGTPSLVERADARLAPFQPAIDRALAKDAAARFATAGEFVNALAASAQPMTSTLIVRPDVPTTVAPLPSHVATLVLPHPARKLAIRPYIIAPAAALILALILVVGLPRILNHPDPTATIAPTATAGLRPTFTAAAVITAVPTSAPTITLAPTITPTATLLPNRSIATLVGHAKGVRALAWSPDGHTLATGSEDSTVRMWTADGAPIRTLTGNTGWVLAVAWSPDGRTLASGAEDNTVRLWSANGTLLTTLTGHTGEVWALGWSPDGRTLASGSADNTVRLWAADGTSLRTLTGHTGSVRGLAWSPDGRTLASGSADNTVRLWAADGAPIRTLTGHTSVVWSVAWSPDGQTLASGSGDGNVRLWGADGTQLRILDGRAGWVGAVGWSPDGHTLASGRGDGTTRLWAPDGSPLATLGGHTQGLRALAWSPDGHTLATGSDDNTVRLWR